MSIYHSRISAANTHIDWRCLCIVRGNIILSFPQLDTTITNYFTFHLSSSTRFEQYNYHQSKVTDESTYCLFTWIEWANAVTSSTTYSTTDIQQLFLGSWLCNYTVYSNFWPTLLFLLNRSSWSTNPDWMHQIPRKKEKDQHPSGDWCQVLPVWYPPTREWHYSFHSS